MSRRYKVGVQFHPQHATMEELRSAWRAADDLRLDSIFAWDHFYPLYGPPDGSHFEGMTLLTAMALDTRHAEVGLMVTCNSYRNPDLLADMYRTLDHLAPGRIILGIGSGWFERDYDEYGYTFGTAGDRLRDLAAGLGRIRRRFDRLTPPPTRPIPVLIGGSGEKVTLRIVAEHGDAWNTFGPPEHFAAKSAVLDRHCGDVGRDPAAIERTVCVGGEDLGRFGEYVEAGADHLIMQCNHPFDLGQVEALLADAEE
jgi:probable F420-dependent oxidoreductase